MRGRSVPPWLSRSLGVAAPLLALVAILFLSGTLKLVVLLVAILGLAASVLVTLLKPISVDVPKRSADPASREPQALLDALDGVISSSRPAFPARFSNGVVLDGERLSAVLDEMRFLLVDALGDLTWYQRRRAAKGEGLLGDSLDRILEDFGGSIDRLDDIVQKGIPSTFKPRMIRVDAQQLSEAVEPLRKWLASYAKELATYRRLYPGLRERAVQIADEQETDLEKAIDEVDDLVREADVMLLRDQVSIDPKALAAITARMRSALSRERTIRDPAELESSIDNLDALAHDAKGVLFTDHVRVGRQEIDDLVEGMRDTLDEFTLDGDQTV